MFCTQCGTRNEEGTTFCTNCGEPLVDVQLDESQQPEPEAITTEVVQSEHESITTEEVQPEPITTEAVQPKNTIQTKSTSIPTQPQHGRKRIPKKILIGGFLLIFIIVGYVMNMKPKINLNKYIHVTSSGYDGYGSADITIDWEAIDDKYGDKIKLTDMVDEEDTGIFSSRISPVEILSEFVDISCDKQTELSNGDKLSYTIEVDEEFTEYLKCKVTTKDGTYEVSDLEKIGKFDPFDDLEVEFTGTAPYGEYRYTYNGEELAPYDFYCDAPVQLKNGDTITISIDENVVETCIQSIGKAPSKLSMDYTVDGLTQYVESYDTLSKEFLTTLSKEAEDTIYSYTASQYSGEMQLSNLTSAGYIMNIPKDESNANDNALYLIYKGSVCGTTIYYPVKFYNILQNGDEFTYQSNDGIMGSIYSSDLPNSSQGYTTPFACYLELVDGIKEQYDTLLGGEFEAYSSYTVVTDLDEVNDDHKQLLQEIDKKLIQTHIETKFAEEVLAGEVNYVGAYLLNAKDTGTELGKKNQYITVYSIVLTHKDGVFDKTIVYYPILHEGLLILTDKTCTIVSTSGIQGESEIEGDVTYYTYGYIDGPTMYNELITAKRANYTYQVSSELKKFGE